MEVSMLPAYLNAHPVLFAIVGFLFLTAIPTVISEFKDPDNNPLTPPPRWVTVLMVIVKIVTWRAPDGTTGILGTQWSLPLLHYPKPTEDPTRPSGGPSGPALALVLALLALSACSTARLTTNAYKGLAIAEATVGAAGKQFAALDRNRRLAIVAGSSSRTDLDAKVAAWEITSERLLKAFEGTDASVKLARDAIAEVRAGMRDKAQLGGWIASAIKIGIDLKDVFTTSGLPLNLGGL